MPHPAPEAQFKRQLKGRHEDKFEKIYSVHAAKDSMLTDAAIKSAANKMIRVDIDRRRWPKCYVTTWDRKEIWEGKRFASCFLQVIVSKRTD